MALKTAFVKAREAHASTRQGTIRGAFTEL